MEETMFDIDQYLNVGVDAAAYFVFALVATAVYLIKLGLEFFVGSADVDFDLEGVEAGMESGAAFSLFSVLSVLAFFMGVGWMGLASRLSWGLGSILSAVLAMGFGAGLLMLTAGLMYGIRRMTHVPRYEVKSAIGQIGKVYLTIPPKGQGQGQVEVAVSGRRKVMAATSADQEIAAFESARIVGVKQGGVFVVEHAAKPRSSPRRGRWSR